MGAELAKCTFAHARIQRSTSISIIQREVLGDGYREAKKNLRGGKVRW